MKKKTDLNLGLPSVEDDENELNDEDEEKEEVLFTNHKKGSQFNLNWRYN